MRVKFFKVVFNEYDSDSDKGAYYVQKLDNSTYIFGNYKFEKIDFALPLTVDDLDDVIGEDSPFIKNADIIDQFKGLDKESARRTSGNGFYYLQGDIARLHSAMLSYARDYMIDNGFTYCIPPFMIRSDVVTGVMSFEEMDAMMYKI